VGTTSLVLLRHGNNSNGMKHFEHHANKDVPKVTQMSHSPSMMYMLKNVTRGNRPKQVGVDNSIMRYMNKDNGAANLNFVRMHVMTKSPHAIASNDHMRSFLRNLACYVPRAHDTVIHHLLEMYMCVADSIRAKRRRAKELYSGLALFPRCL